MHVIAEHEVSNPKSFWGIAKKDMAKPPSNLKLHQVLPNGDGTKAVCLWEAAKVHEVKTFVDGSVGHVSHNTYFGIEARNTIGLAVHK
jgi:hypothetical protein